MTTPLSRLHHCRVAVFPHSRIQAGEAYYPVVQLEEALQTHYTTAACIPMYAPVEAPLASRILLGSGLPLRQQFLALDLDGPHKSLQSAPESAEASPTTSDPSDWQNELLSALTAQQWGLPSAVYWTRGGARLIYPFPPGSEPSLHTPEDYSLWRLHYHQVWAPEFERIGFPIDPRTADASRLLYLPHINRRDKGYNTYEIAELSFDPEAASYPPWDPELSNPRVYVPTDGPTPATAADAAPVLAVAAQLLELEPGHNKLFALAGLLLRYVEPELVFDALESQLSTSGHPKAPQALEDLHRKWEAWCDIPRERLPHFRALGDNYPDEDAAPLIAELREHLDVSLHDEDLAQPPQALKAATPSGAHIEYRTVFPSETSWKELTEEYCKRQIEPLVIAQNEFWEWNGKFFDHLDEHKLNGRIAEFLSSIYILDKKGGPARIPDKNQNIQELKRSLLSYPGIPHQDEGLQQPSHLRAFEHAVLDVRTGEMIPHHPSQNLKRLCPFNWTPNAPHPEWDRFLLSLKFEPEEHRHLQEVVGFLVYGDLSLQRIPLFIGPPRAGKGTVGKLVQRMKRRSITPTIESLVGNFSPSGIEAADFIYFPDLRHTGTYQTQASAVEMLLQISAGDPVEVRRKYLSNWKGVLDAKILVISNTIPAFKDAGRALERRWVAVQFKESFVDDPDLHLDQKLTPELDAIAHWAWRGWVRLQDRGRFIEPQSSRDAHDDLTALANADLSFIDEWCALDPEAHLTPKQLYQAYQMWCEEAGHHRASRAQFRASLLAARLPGVKWGVRRSRHEQRQVKGIRLLSLKERDAPLTTEHLNTPVAE
jgi:P4 family phage/plasmid primase-like protien